MALDDLDVVGLGRQRPRGLGDQAHQHVDAQREVTGADHRHALCGLVDPPGLLGRKPGRADHQRDAASRRHDRQRRRGARRSEIDHHIGHGQGVFDADQALGLQAWTVEPGHDGHRWVRGGSGGHSLTHATERAGDGDLDGTGQGRLSGVGVR